MGHIQGIGEAANALAVEIAEMLGTSPAEAIGQALASYKANLDRLGQNPDAPEWLRQLWREHPLPPPTGQAADKAFFDELSGDL
jgi:antitoxin VapB